MKHLLLFLTLCLASAIGFAQGTDKSVEKEDGNYNYHYFQGSTKVSTLWFMAKSTGSGYAVAYNQGGKEIYRGELSIRNMIRGVQFQYHPNGAVSKAHATWHPDAGIQRGGTTYFFDDQGNATGKTEDIDPHHPLKVPSMRPSQEPDEQLPPVVKPVVRPVTPPQPAKPEVVKEAPIYHTEYFIVNTTNKPLKLRIDDPQGKPIDGERFIAKEIAPGDTIKGGEFINAGFHGNPCDYVRFVVFAKKAKWSKDATIDCKQAVFREPNPAHREVFYFIRMSKPGHD
jgi:hypothetical protein